MRPALLLVAQLVAAPLGAQADDSVAAADVRRHITVLAHDSLRGRGTPSAGLERAARYVAAGLRRAGLRPLGDSGTFIQRYRIIESRLVGDSSFVEFRGPAPRTFRLGHQVDWLRISEPVAGPITGPAVLVTGIPDSTAPFAGLDVRGAVIVHLAPTQGERVETPEWLFAAGARAGVGAWILVVDRPDDRWRALTGQIDLPRTVVPGTPETWPFPVLEMRDGTLGRYLAELGVAQAGIRPIPPIVPAVERLDGMTVRVRLRERVLSRRSAPNVLALLPGSDTAGAAVIVAAHLDALGVGPVIGSDSIYNGADDNASGVAAVLEAARVLARGPAPARPVVFAFFSGTERGLTGVSYYMGRPAIPVARTAAFVNVEAIGRNLRDTVAVVGGAQSGLASLLDGLRPAAAAFGLAVAADPWPSQRLWLLGDHGRFGLRGVPVLYLFNGRHGDLHRPGDESRKIEFAAVARIARFVALLARRLALPST
jgi:hypothetical protein